MYLQTFLTIFLVSFFAVTASEYTYSSDKCHYRATVDLTNQTLYDNGSYEYQKVLIPIEKQQFYDYNLLFMGEKVAAKRHLRGCVCDRPKPCIKLCCEEGEFFNTSRSSLKCEKLYDKVNWNLTIRLTTRSERKVNIIEQYIYQVGVPCKKPEALVMKVDVWELEEDGQLYVDNIKSKLDTLNYCLTPIQVDGYEENILVPLNCPRKNTAEWDLQLNMYGMAISVLFLIPTVVVYLLIKELRGNLRGKLLICYLMSLTIVYSIISFINISEIQFEYLECCILGFTCYFFFMSAFLWLSVLCHDIWNNFKETNIELNSRRNHKYFIYYSIYAWGLALICTGLVVAAQLSPNEYIDGNYKPGIGVDRCWLNTDNWSAAVYFYGPNLIILIFNFITFGHITMRIYRVRRDLAAMTHRERFMQENAVVILRLFLIMGISWLFDILSYSVRMYPIVEIFFTLSNFANALQGLLIFTLFVLKRNVLKLLKNRFRAIKTTSRSVSSITTNCTKVQSSNCPAIQGFSKE